MNVNRKVLTLDEFTLQQLRNFPNATGELSNLLRDIGLAAKRINVEVNKAGLVDILGDAGTVNVQGEDVKKLDVYANDQFMGVLRHGISCAGIGSEELDDSVVFDDDISNNESTTLGREGSDYSAAVFANLLDAESQTIWKDVAGVMNADPKQFPDATVLAELNYDEVIEMAYYGAQVIHPKTIKPLQNKDIPLYVKCFLDPALPGTVIHNGSVHGLPPIIVLKKDQVLVHLHSKDFSFVGESGTARLYDLFGQVRVKPNLIQSGAVSLQACLDDHPEKIEKLALEAAALFDVQIERGLTLLTIRHYNQEVLGRLTAGRKEVLRQQTPATVQILMYP